MPSNRPTLAVWQEASQKLGCTLPAIKAVFEVEAAGNFYDRQGRLLRRFEPHEFPSAYWAQIGFVVPTGTPAWKASLKLSTTKRRKMFDKAEQINAEKAYEAASWGAPQTMGFNCKLAGYASAQEMVAAYEQSADNQVMGFVNFCISAGLDTHLRSHDWSGFAAGYNGSGQVATYAARIESAYRRQSGGVPSAVVLRVGASGSAVEQLQTALVAQGYSVTVDGHFGAETLDAVKKFQASAGLKVDGIVGATTQGALAERGRAIVHPKSTLQKTQTQQIISKVVSQAGPAVTSGGAIGMLGSLDPTTQHILVAGVILAAVVLGVVWLRRN